MSEVPLHLLLLQGHQTLHRLAATCNGAPGANSNCEPVYRGTSLIRKRPLPPKDHQRALGIGLRQSPRGGSFLMSEVPL